MSVRFGRKPIALRTDNGREYVTSELTNFLKKEGIQHQLTVPYTPQQNGVAERKNRTLTEAAKCMLLDADLDNRFWGEAVLTAVYLQNRTISRSINKTPIELFTGEKPDINHIRVFGSKVYSLVPKQRRRKWDDKAEEDVLVGYDENTKGYRILDPNTNRVWINRSVRIIEHDAHRTSLHPTHKEEGTNSNSRRQPRTVNYEIPAEEEKAEEVYEDDPEEETESESCPSDEEEYDTPKEPQKRASQRTNKGVPPLRLTYKVQTNSVKEPESWSKMLELPLRE